MPTRPSQPAPQRRPTSASSAAERSVASRASGGQREKEQLERLYARPGFLLRRAHQIASGVFEDESSACDLTPAQFGTLLVIHLLPGLDQSTLARALGYDKVTTLRVLRGLEARGLLERGQSSNNRRNISLRLSDSGELLLAQGRQAASRAARRVIAPLSPLEQTQLIELLQKLTGALEPQARAQWIRPPLAGAGGG